MEVLGALSKREKETTMRSKRLILILCLLGALSLNASIEVNIHVTPKGFWDTPTDSDFETVL